MKDKTRFLIAILISVAIFLMILVASLYNQQKTAELQFNERKAKLIKENLDLKDKSESYKETLQRNNEAMALLKEKSRAVEDQIMAFEQEKEALKDEYDSRILELKEENNSLSQRIDDLENMPLTKKIERSLEEEENEALRQFLAKVIYNIKVIREGGNIELEPIVVTESGSAEQQSKIARAAEEGGVGLVSEMSGEATGRIISTDPKYSLVVFDLGRKDNVNRGQQCSIYKDEERIATAEIISARYRVSAAFVYEMEYGYNVRDIKEGDAITIVESF